MKSRLKHFLAMIASDALGALSVAYRIFMAICLCLSICIVACGFCGWVVDGETGLAEGVFTTWCLLLMLSAALIWIYQRWCESKRWPPAQR